MFLRSYSHVFRWIFIATVLTPMVAFAKTEPCTDGLLAPQKIKSDTYFDLRRNLSALDKTHGFKPSRKHLRALAEDLPFSELVDLAVNISRGSNAESALRHLILHNSADFNERREIIQILASDWEQLFRVEKVFDEILGIPREQVEEIEEADGSLISSEVHDLGIRTSHDFWFTTPSRLVLLIEEIQRRGSKHVVDLGCGTGRLGILLGFLAPEVKFTGLELYGPRVDGAKRAADRWGFSSRIQFVQQDLLDKQRSYPDGDFYYIYGPTNEPSINNRVVDRLKMKTGTFTIASNHTMTTRYLSDQEWLASHPENVPLNRMTMWYFDAK